MKFWGTAEVVKRQKRLWIQVMETEAPLYTPPDFLRHRIHGRDRLQALADVFTQKQERCIGAIMAFEASLIRG
jgi:hypothetical protein